MGTNELPSEIRRFKEIREDHDFTQSEFAEQLGIKHSTADIERGRTKLSGRVVTELLRLFNVNPLWLFGYSNQKHLTTDNGDISPKVVVVDKEDQENMILVNQKAAAGYPNNIQDVEWYQKLPAFDLPLPQYRNATYRGFQVEGDSMLPNFRPDDWVLAKGVESLDYASDNKVYVVVMQDASGYEVISEVEVDMLVPTNESDLNFAFDFGYRFNRSFRNAFDNSIETSEPTRGNKTITINPAVDYDISKKLNARLFFDYTRTIPTTTAQFPTTSIAGGVRIRFTLD